MFRQTSLRIGLAVALGFLSAAAHANCFRNQMGHVVCNGWANSTPPVVQWAPQITNHVGYYWHGAAAAVAGAGIARAVVPGQFFMLPYQTSSFGHHLQQFQGTYHNVHQWQPVGAQWGPGFAPAMVWLP